MQLDPVGLAELRRRVREEALRELEQDDGLRLRDLEEGRRVDLDADQDKPRVFGRPVARVATVLEPDLPVLGVELADLLAILCEGGEARDRDPLARLLVVVGEVDVRIGLDVGELSAAFRGDEPEIGPPRRASGSPSRATRGGRPGAWS